MDSLELLLHPLRLRIMHAMSGGRTLTTSQLCALLPDASKATLYRHVSLLADHGLLEIEEERRVRGAVERRFRMSEIPIEEGTAAATTIPPEGHRQLFAVTMATLIAEFNAYLDRPGAEPAEDAVGYRQRTMWLSPEELADFIREMTAVIAPRIANEPSPERNRYLISTILFPAEDSEKSRTSG
ncbi:helix-turn-helix domain-containing protein [Streptomyces silvensis]|uniref:ArsR family transcriptional regulator n=1 Tax=Streptomyces silvensis TaxID=1765722 RepID=A0A0W7X1A6_9ACTN|nr:helix-turn-helix domain-containing protein [Streptomyces silvensis]KUF16621.1 ArsR family transcriptional regulator [Streptomyces silvensis]